MPRRITRRYRQPLHAFCGRTRTGQWEAVIPRLQRELPQLYALGDYWPENRTGLAIWLRCVLAGTVSPEPENRSESKVGDVPPKHSVPENIPIFYLPGVSRQDLRAIESCPEYLKSLAELQYRGTLWSQINAEDWTIFAFLKSDQGGFGLDVAQDSATRNAMQPALYLLMDEDTRRPACAARWPEQAGGGVSRPPCHEPTPALGF